MKCRFCDWAPPLYFNGSVVPGRVIKRTEGGEVLAIVRQQNLFSWQDVEELGDLERLKLVIETMPDRELIQALERRRKGKRDDYPIIAMWNSVLAEIGRASCRE